MLSGMILARSFEVLQDLEACAASKQGYRYPIVLTPSSAVKELKLSCNIGETLLFTISTHYGIFFRPIFRG